MTQYKAVVLLLGSALLAGCATVSETSRLRTEDWRTRREAVAPEPVVVLAEEDEAEETSQPSEPEGDPFAIAPLDDPTLTEVISDSHTYYEVGREAFRFGDIETARDYFDRALDELCETVDEGRTEVEPLLDNVAEYVAAFELAWAEWDGSDADGTDAYVVGEVAAIDQINEVDLPDVTTASTPAAHGPLHVLNHDVPLVINNQVLAMLDLYTGRLRDQIEPAFHRSGRYVPMMRKIFEEEGVPLDLVWLSMVESGFKPTAYSRARAKGLWQFIYSTGRMYKLGRTYWVDDRSDPFKATRAAARHLRDLHDVYGDWYLVLAAYNAGPGKVNRAIRKVGKKDYWAIASSPYLRRETKNYVPAYLATLLIAQDPAAYGFNPVTEDPWTFDTLTIDGPADLEVIAEIAGTTLAEMKLHNPELRQQMTPGDRKTYELRVPSGKSDQVAVAYAQLPQEKRLRFATHRVARGDTLGRIAQRYGVGVDTIAAANGLQSRHRIHVGTELVIPLSRGADVSTPSDERVAKRSRPSQPAAKAFHRVRRGETLTRIAARNGVTVAQLKSWNGLRSDRIQSGTSLRLQPDTRRGRTSASSAARSSKSKSRTVRHRVRRGETMWEIAKRYGVKVSDIARWNGQDDATVIRPGQRLEIHLN